MDTKTTTDYDEALAPLRRLLRRGDGDWLSLLWDHGQRGGAAADQPPTHGLLHGADRLVHDLLFRGEPVSFEQVREILGAGAVELLMQAHVLRREGEQLAGTGLRIRCHQGLRLFAGAIERPGPEPAGVVHLGPDSLALAEILAYQRPCTKAADICAGSGILGLCLANSAEQVVGVELVPDTAEVARINVALAGASRKVDIRQGNLFAPLAGERFDLIVSNPPFVPSLEDPRLDPVGAGGADGLEIVRALWRDAPDYLSEDGRLCIITGLLGDGDGPFAAGEIEAVSIRHGWRSDLLELQEAMPVERLRFTPVIEEDSGRRIRQIQEAAERCRATHYYVGLILSSPASPAGFFRSPLYRPATDRMRLAVNELRKRRKARK